MVSGLSRLGCEAASGTIADGFELRAGKHTVFGRLVGGQDVLDKIERVPIDPATDRPLKPVTLIDVEVFGDPFEDYKERLAKRLKREENERLGFDEKRRRKEERDKDRTT